MKIDLEGKVAIVTGAGRGIGREIAATLAGEGVTTVVTDVRQEYLDAWADEFARRSWRGQQHRCDVRDAAQIERVVATVVEAFGRVDILVNNAGAIRGGAFLDIPDAQWINDWNLKLLGYIRMARAVFPIMQGQGGGRIVNVVGAAARNPTAVYLTGGAANAALVNFTKGLADLGAESNILVTAVSPAATRTERWDSLMEQQAKASGKSVAETRAAAQAPYKLGRIATPEDIADVVCFLTSARASFITGICITVDGGATRGVYQ